MFQGELRHGRGGGKKERKERKLYRDLLPTKPISGSDSGGKEDGILAPAKKVRCGN